MRAGSHRIADRAARPGRTSLLLTGFGPFPKVPVNATMLLVPVIARAARRLYPDVDIAASVLPTEWRAAPRLADELVAKHAPDVVIHFGVSGRARGFEIETRGHNLREMAPDASGERPLTPAIAVSGRHRLPAGLPVAEIVRRLRARHIPAYRSWSAGTYLCNALLYHALTNAEHNACAAGFVHIPSSLAQTSPWKGNSGPARAAPDCPLTITQALEGGLEIVAACLRRPSLHARQIAHALNLAGLSRRAAR